MNAVTVISFNDLPFSTRIGIAWGFLWRGLVAAVCCAVAGVLVGVALGLVAALIELASRSGSWHEVFVHYSHLFRELLTELPV